MEVNRKNIRNAMNYHKAASEVKSGESVLLLLFRNGSTLYVTLSRN